jgi:hypothetical protein
MNHRQTATARRLSRSLPATSLIEVFLYRGTAALLAQETDAANEQGPLPDNQWTIEISKWFAIGLAKLQQEVVEFATGPQSEEYSGLYKVISDPETIRMCHSRKVKQSGCHISFLEFCSCASCRMDSRTME